MSEFEKFVEERDRDLRQMKAKNQQMDDENSQLIDGVTSQMSEASQRAQAKRRTLQENSSKLQRLQSQV